MPLIHSKSKKAMSKNIETEMNAGKPQKQSIAIAYSVARRAKPKKKMAFGGAAENDGNPNPGSAVEHTPSTSVAGQKAPGNLSEAHMGQMEHCPVCNGPCKELPAPQHFADGGQTLGDIIGYPKGASKADGGMIEMESPITADSLTSEEMDMIRNHRNQSLGANTGAKSESRPTPEEIDNDSDEISRNRGNKPLEDADWTDNKTIHEAIMEKRKAGKVKMMADGGMIDEDDDSLETPGLLSPYDEDNEMKAGKKELYDVHQLSAQPEDSNETGDSEESDSENEHDEDIVSKIRKKMKKSVA